MTKLLNLFKFNKTNLAKEVLLGNDAELVKEFISKVEQGAYLHKYSGLWALGLDLLPPSAQRYLHLFVYKGCACSIDVWFKNPTTPKALIPFPNGIEADRKDCSKRYTNNSVYEFGNISDGGKFVSFSLWASNNGSSGSIVFFNSTDDFLGIDFIGRQIQFSNYMVSFLIFSKKL
uniref:Uncharacterized protein n=1 Tax=Meloidogyne enterolobii TaxID=390850 RepID=A0A6V7XDX8_MELEN|nr:unnamed protein product [Meloidogyne enterolobii]